jgi:hypothetical protein
MEFWHGFIKPWTELLSPWHWDEILYFAGTGLGVVSIFFLGLSFIILICNLICKKEV